MSVVQELGDRPQLLIDNGQEVLRRLGPVSADSLKNPRHLMGG